MEQRSAAGGFRIPKQQQPTRTSFDTRPRKVATWIAELPLASVGETARLLYNALTETNRLIIDDAQRLKLLGLLVEPVRYVSESLGKHYLGQAFPLAEKKRKIAEFTRTLAAEMAIGHIVVFNNSLVNGGSRLSDPVMADLIHRAIEHLNTVLLTCFETYAPVPEQLWREMHQLYLYAERHNLQVRSIERETGTTTIEACYKQGLLLAAASPYRMRQTDLGVLFQALARWSAKCRINPTANDSLPGDALIVDLNSDAPPGYLALRREPCAASCRVLDTFNLVQLVRRIAEATAGESAAGRDAPQVSAALARHLLRAWGSMTKRHFTRTRRHEQARLTIGLSETHHFISPATEWPEADKPHAEPAFDVRSTFTSKTTASLNPNDTLDVWNLYRPELVKPPGGEAEQRPDWQARKIRYHIHLFTLLNEGAGGLCLACRNQDLFGKLQVGELLGVWDNEQDSLQTLSIAVIRWMKNSDGQLEFGVQLLAPSATAVGVAHRPAKGEPQEYLRSLWLPELAVIGQPATLIVPSVFRSGSQLIVNRHGEIILVRLGKALEESGVFGQFQFDILDRGAAPKAPGHDGGRVGDSGAGFEIVWDLS